MVSWATSIVPIVVVVISVILTPIAANYFQRLDKPNMIVSIQPNFDKNNSKTVFRMLNSGTASATNISLIIISSKKISEVLTNDSATDITLPQLPKYYDTLTVGEPKSISPTHLLQIRIPKLVYGEGSTTNIQIETDRKDRTENNSYTGIVTYDQGSGIVTVKKQFVSDEFSRSCQAFLDPFLVSAFLTSSLFFILSLTHYLLFCIINILSPGSKESYSSPT